MGCSFYDEANEEVTLAVGRGVRATSAFKEADPVVLKSKFFWTILTLIVFNSLIMQQSVSYDQSKGTM